MRADMDGFISKFDVYQGQNIMPKDYNFPACFGSSSTFYIRPTSKNYHVYFGNYF